MYEEEISHNFLLKSSSWQGYAILACHVLLLVWIFSWSTNVGWPLSLKIIAMAAVCINAWYKYRQSLDWQFGFNLSEQGHGHLLDGRIIEFKYRLLITKICLIAIIKVQHQPWQLLVIWGDMLPKPYYHLLSRIICQLKV